MQIIEIGRINQRARAAMNAPETYIPLPHRESLIQYIEHGRQLDSFLMCILDNNLQGAIREATTASAMHIVSIVRWLWKFAPADCWGSENARRGWADARRWDAQRSAA